MTDKQQPPVAPERIWIDPQDSTFWNDTGDVKSLIPYARVRPVDEGRVEEIRGKQTSRRWGNPSASTLLDDIDYLLSLLPELSGSEPRSVYHCSCGAACTADEYIEHLLQGHDRSEALRA